MYEVYIYIVYTPEQVLRSVAGNDGDGSVSHATPGEGERVYGEGERVGAVTETPVPLVAGTEGLPLAVLCRVRPVTHHRCVCVRERERERGNVYIRVYYFPTYHSHKTVKQLCISQIKFQKHQNTHIMEYIMYIRKTVANDNAH